MQKPRLAVIPEHSPPKPREWNDARMGLDARLLAVVPREMRWIPFSWV